MSLIDGDQNHENDDLSTEELAAFETMRSGGELPIEGDGALREAPPAEEEEQVQQQPGQRPAPEETPDPEDDIDVIERNGTRGKRVALGKFLRTEEKAKKLEAELEDLRKERAAQSETSTRLDERLRIINEALQSPAQQPAQQQAEQDPMPNPDADIFGYAAWQGRQLNRLSERLEGMENAGREREAENEMAEAYSQDARRFAQSEDGITFKGAYEYLIAQRDQELLINGVADAKARQRQILAEEKGLVRSAIDAGQSPAERIFRMAAGRGFNPAAWLQQARQAAGGGTQPQQRQQAKQQDDPNALDAPAAAAQQRAPAQRQQGNGQARNSVTEQIEAINRGQQAAATLSTGGGGAPPQELTQQQLLAMDEEDFALYVASLSKTDQKRLMGG